MITVREQMIVDEIKEETDSYSDDSLFNITSFGTDMTFRELITMYEEGDLEKPEMQRNYVWNKNEASRFIDSVLLGLPVPSIFLAKTKDEKRLIVDGYQRIMTVYDYVQRGIFGGDNKSFALSNSEIINKRWRGKTFQELQPEEKRRIRNFPIHAIVFEQKEPQDDTGMYQIFERINTGGRTLKPQEIRNCVYHGEFNKLLIELNNNINWRKMYNNGAKDTRMADIELILRMFAFGYIYSQEEIQQKQINLVKYLNQFMKRNDSFGIVSKEELSNNFNAIMEFFVNNFSVNIFRNGKKKDDYISFSKRINPAIVDSIFAATMYINKKNGLDFGESIDFTERYERLILMDDYQDSISKRTTNIDKIQKRINLACEVLYGEHYEW
ncbi:MAG TPA: DUF262 domain-containing protein [Candidatus Onthocola gallistercoris]|uniref:DUF262 domain-containing protein n=1 Tax=Candidatus Onthocola gallistercoris TaxID=2840876 RepID=A0A9D1HGQ3_9FIRM|nr:DUF262 domain-containing protein [Candidatus Onthocola gallistercoris]